MAADKQLTPAKFFIVTGLLTIFLFVSIAAGLLIGSVDISVSELAAVVTGGNIDSSISRIIIDIRLPRVLLAIAVGGGLSIAGAVFQALLMNPLAEPYILGISSGGTFGAILSFLFGLSFIYTQLFAFGVLSGTKIRRTRTECAFAYRCNDRCIFFRLNLIDVNNNGRLGSYGSFLVDW
jgi:ABC-type Fe3+-siderophore transport system permease subunit